jgi:hypothetical protein
MKKLPPCDHDECPLTRCLLVELEQAKASVRETQSAASDAVRIQSPQCGGEVRCAGCGGTYEDAPGNFCSFCV